MNQEVSISTSEIEEKNSMQLICVECIKSCKDFREGKYLCPFFDSELEQNNETDERFLFFKNLFLIN